VLRRVVLRDAMMVVLDLGVPAVVPVMRRGAVHGLWRRRSRYIGDRDT